MEYFCENTGIEIVDSVKAYGCLAEDDVVDSQYFQECYDAAKKLKEALM